MATKKITELAELVTATNDDVFPIVDVGNDITKKIKTVNLPISSATQTALNGKQDVLAFTPEDVANKSTSVTTDQASNTKYPSVKAVYDWAVGLFATIAQLATKQDTLVSGTNIKTVNSTSLLGSGNVSVQETLVSGTNIRTINSTSLLGSGDISIQANPSGGAGAIQFSNGSAFASDSNLFWDNTNKRLGVGTNAPSGKFQINDSATSLEFNVNNTFQFAELKTNRTLILFSVNGVNALRVLDTGTQIGVVSGSPSARLQIRGSGSTSATTALLVQNSGQNNALQVRDDRVIICAGMPTSSSGLPSGALWSDGGTIKIV